MGFAHGSNDAQKTMGIIALTLVARRPTGTLEQPAVLAGVPASVEGAIDNNDIDTWIKSSPAPW